MAPHPLWLLYNPVAGHGRAARLAPAVAERLEGQGYDVTLVQTAGAGKAAEQVRWLLQHRPAPIAVLGGDGTVHDAINGFLIHGEPIRSEATLIVLNAGTGGDFARGLGLPRDPFAGVARLASATLQPLDLGWIQCLDRKGQRTGRAFVNVADVGLAGDVVARVNRTTKKLGGFASFLLGTLTALAKAEAKPMQLSVDGGTPEAGRWVMLSVANGTHFGGGMALCPSADPGDGRFDLVTLGDLDRRTLYTHLPHLYRGKHLALPGVTHRSMRTLHVDTDQPVWVEADGELIGTTPATIRIVPAALHVLV